MMIPEGANSVTLTPFCQYPVVIIFCFAVLFALKCLAHLLSFQKEYAFCPFKMSMSFVPPKNGI